MVLEGVRAGRKAERCEGIHLVDEAGNCLGYIDFMHTGELELYLDPRISVTMEAGGLELTRHLPELRVGPYYSPTVPTVENNLDVLTRHMDGLKLQGVTFSGQAPTQILRPGVSYSFTSRSR